MTTLVGLSNEPRSFLHISQGYPTLDADSRSVQRFSSKWLMLGFGEGNPSQMILDLYLPGSRFYPDLIMLHCILKELPLHMAMYVCMYARMCVTSAAPQTAMLGEECDVAKDKQGKSPQPP